MACCEPFASFLSASFVLFIPTNPDRPTETQTKKTRMGIRLVRGGCGVVPNDDPFFQIQLRKKDEIVPGCVLLALNELLDAFSNVFFKPESKRGN